MDSTGRVRWRVVVPVKHRTRAKTRLRPYDDDARSALALAMAGDVVEALLACAAVDGVLVVTDDPGTASAFARLGAATLRDAPDGLNPAVSAGAQAVADGVHGTAALLADLPALRPDDVAAALAVVPASGRGLVPDADGTGTTLLAAAPGVPLQPAFGPGSCARHLAAGAVLLPGAPGLRRDVDTPADLAHALALGVGPRTAAAAEAVA